MDKFWMSAGVRMLDEIISGRAPVPEDFLLREYFESQADPNWEAIGLKKIVSSRVNIDMEAGWEEKVADLIRQHKDDGTRLTIVVDSIPESLKDPT